MYLLVSICIICFVLLFKILELIFFILLDDFKFVMVFKMFLYLLVVIFIVLRIFFLVYEYLLLEEMLNLEVENGRCFVWEESRFKIFLNFNFIYLICVFF